MFVRTMSDSRADNEEGKAITGRISAQIHPRLSQYFLYLNVWCKVRSTVDRGSPCIWGISDSESIPRTPHHTSSFVPSFFSHRDVCPPAAAGLSRPSHSIITSSYISSCVPSFSLVLTEYVLLAPEHAEPVVNPTPASRTTLPRSMVLSILRPFWKPHPRSHLASVRVCDAFVCAHLPQ